MAFTCRAGPNKVLYFVGSAIGLVELLTVFNLNDYLEPLLHSQPRKKCLIVNVDIRSPK